MSFSGHDSSRLERDYSVRVEVSLLLALAAHAAVLMLAPAYVPRPYQLDASPLRLVKSGGGAAGGDAFPGTSTSSRTPKAGDADPMPVSSERLRAPLILTEQLKPSSSEAPPRGAHSSIGGDAAAREGAGIGGVGTGEGTGSGEGADDGAPPVFYAFDSPPRVVSRVVPEYPAAVKAQGGEGTVILNANVDERGRVTRVWVAQSTAPGDLVESAIDAMYRFRFSPGSQQGVPVMCTVAVPFNFHLNIHL
jgi:protein TonB